MKGQNVGYIRVSSVEKNVIRQLAGVDLDMLFVDKIKGSVKSRPELDKLLNHVRSGDTVHVHNISRLARNVSHLLEFVELLTSKGVSVKFHQEGLHFTNDKNPIQDLMLMLTVIGAISAFELTYIKHRQFEGIQIAKAAGKYKGRQTTVNKQVIIDCLRDGLSFRKAAEKTNVSLSTVQRAAKLA
jgi:DNA invertase Pin-like site-specific DNA recombinase